jgi:hypothetical protein
MYTASYYGHAGVVRVLLADRRVDGLGAIQCASKLCAHLFAEDVRFGIEQHRELYEKHHPELVQQYDAALARGLTMAWVAKQHRPWESLVEPMAKRLKAGFICE